MTIITKPQLLIGTTEIKRIWMQSAQGLPYVAWNRSILKRLLTDRFTVHRQGGDHGLTTMSGSLVKKPMVYGHSIKDRSEEQIRKWQHYWSLKKNGKTQRVFKCHCFRRLEANFVFIFCVWNVFFAIIHRALVGIQAGVQAIAEPGASRYFSRNQLESKSSCFRRPPLFNKRQRKMVKSSLNISWMMGLREINYQFLNEGSALTTHLRRE